MQNIIIHLLSKIKINEAVATGGRGVNVERFIAHGVEKETICDQKENQHNAGTNGLEACSADPPGLRAEWRVVTSYISSFTTFPLSLFPMTRFIKVNGFTEIVSAEQNPASKIMGFLCLLAFFLLECCNFGKRYNAQYSWEAIKYSDTCGQASTSLDNYENVFTHWVWG